jgi:hypothetical protein
MMNFLKFLAVCIIAAIGVGFYYRMNEDVILGDRIIGLAVLASAFILNAHFFICEMEGKKT